ncbi:MAG TPA: hypothetical protein VGN46_14345 [Luteibacter sp.]|uniref:hypothetical protein n=1 Tax=Luteibacter sp. TaxID=1886636 RepID=UPI002F3F7047
MELDNPASRLHDILARGKIIPATDSCRTAWGQLLGSGSNQALTMARLGKVMELPQQSLNAMEVAFPHRVGACSHWVGKLSSAFGRQDLDGVWETFIKFVDEQSMSLLGLTADLLGGLEKRSRLDIEHLSQVREQLNELLVAVLASDVSADVKRWVVNYLRKIIVAIDEYHITGALAVVEATDGALGHARANPEYRSFLRDHELGGRVLEGISAAANLVTVAMSLPELAHVSQLMLGG